MSGPRLRSIGAGALLLAFSGCTPRDPAPAPVEPAADAPARSAAPTPDPRETRLSTTTGGGTTADDTPQPGAVFDVTPPCRESVTLDIYPPPPPKQLIGPTMPSFPCEPQLGADVCEVQEALNLYQPYLESFGWQSFTALNWPAVKNDEGRWVPDRGRRIGDGEGDALPVWQTWLTSDQVFVEDPPANWGDKPELAESCKVGPDEWVVPYDNSMFAVDQAGETPNQKTGPLIDQNGQWVQYDVRMNRSAWQYITQNGLATVRGQIAFKKKGKPVDMPAGAQPKEKISCVDWPDGAPPLPMGAIDVKVAWKVLGDGDDPKRYHTAMMIMPPDDAGACARVKLGLAALHIKHKTPYGTGTTNSAINPHIWSTFIQVDALCDGDRSGAFCKAGCDDTECPPNVQVCNEKDGCARPTPSNTGTLAGPKTQVDPLVPITESSQGLNRRMQKALAAINPESVWQHYSQITTQWVMPLLPYNVISTGDHSVGSQQGNAFVATAGIIQPSFAANPLIETYVQNGSTCLGCHQQAKTAAGQPSDLSYQLRHAVLRGEKAR